MAIPGQRFALTLRVTNRSPVKLERGEAGIARTQGWEVTEKTPAGDLPSNNATWRAQFEAKVPDNAAYTRPYWSRVNEWRDHIYQINEPQYHLPFAPPELLASSVMKSKACASCSLAPCKPSLWIARGVSSAAC